MREPTSHANELDSGEANTASVATAVFLSLIVVSASFTLSFNALADLADMSGAIPSSLTWLLPIVIDVFILQATWCVYVATRRRDDAGKRYHFAMLATFSTVSVAGNAGHAFLATEQSLMHGLMAVAIAIVAPLALLASIHGLVMHVWTRGDSPSRPHLVVEEHVSAGARATPRAHDEPKDRASHAHSLVNEAETAAPELAGDNRAANDAPPLNRKEIDELISEGDLHLARLVCSRGRLRNDERAVARVLVAERLRVPREGTAVLTGVHRTTIGRWMELAAECRTDADPRIERGHASEQPALVDVP